MNKQQPNPFVNGPDGPFDAAMMRNAVTRMAARKLMDAWYLTLKAGQKEQVEELAASGRMDVIWDLYSGTPGFPKQQIEALTETLGYGDEVPN